MLKQLQIKNFQSHKNTVIDFSPELTVIVGKNDNGKSAIFRSLRKLYRDLPLGDKFITNGEDSTEITGIVNDNTIIRKVSRTKPNSYKVNDNPFSGFKNDIPEEVILALDISEILELDGTKIDFNFRGQREDGKLFDLTPSVKSKLINYISGLLIFDNAVKSARKKSQDAKQNEKQALLKIGELNIDIEKYYKQLAYKDIVLYLQNNYKSIIERKNNFTVISELFVTSQNIYQKAIAINRVLKQTEVLGDVSVNIAALIPENIKLQSIRDSYLRYNTINNNITFVNYKLDNLKNITNLSDNICINISKAEQISKINILFKKYQDIESIIEYTNTKLSIAVPDINDELLNKTKTLKDITEKFSDLRNINIKVNIIEQTLSEHIEKFEQLKIKISDMIKEFGGICPVCGNVLKDNKFC